MKGLWKQNKEQVIGSIMRHKISTEDGNSGSPIMIKRFGEPLVIAIHRGCLPHLEVNQGRLITEDLLTNLVKWEKEMKIISSELVCNYFINC